MPVSSRSPHTPKTAASSSAPGPLAPDTALTFSPSGDELARALALLAPVALADMTHAALMDRCESKYLLHLADLPTLLSTLSPHYRVLTIGGEAVLPYRSLYLDTPDFEFYYAHHNGRSRRYKVRFRSYEQTSTTFLEVKARQPGGRTVKTRTSVAAVSFPLPDDGAALVEQVPAAQPLEAKLWVNYGRITLVAHDRPERVTIDLHLEFQRPDGRQPDGGQPEDGPPDGGQTVRAEHLVIVELKRASARQPSALETYARSLGQRSGGFSKYGVGCSLLYPVRHNAFKPQRLAMSRLAMSRLQRSA